MLTSNRPTLRLKLASGQALPVVWLSMGSVAIAEMAARSGAGAIVLDLQHGLWERRDVEAAIGIAQHHCPVMVRVAENSEAAISMALDAGAEGVIVPLVESARQARAAVAAARFPRTGSRSGGGVRPLQDFNGYFEWARDGVVVAVMIETAKGVRKARKIARTEGLDMVFIGTGDLMISLGAFPDFNLDVMQACARVHRACRQSYVPCGIFTPNAEMAAMRNGHGYRMVVVANDIETVRRGFCDAVGRFGRDPATPPPAAGRELPTLPVPRQG
ncbi:MAG: aldolase/citrate lyase family protein [Hyphomicrobiaceae bacterium]